MNPALLERAGSIPEVLDRLEAIQAELHRETPRGRHDGLACFNYLYRVITKDVSDTLDTDGFADPTFLRNLDVAFANRYLEALRADQTGHRRVPNSWKVLFDRRHSTSISPLQFAIAGVNAHVNLDLAHAVVNTCDHLRTDLSHGHQHADYQIVNRIFAKHMQRLRQHFEDHLGRCFDDMASKALNRAGDVVVTVSRDAAWLDAQLLWKTRKQAAAHKAVGRWLELSAGVAGATILLPLRLPGRAPGA